jgi:hypothetical protein
MHLHALQFVLIAQSLTVRGAVCVQMTHVCGCVLVIVGWVVHPGFQCLSF